MKYLSPLLTVALSLSSTVECKLRTKRREQRSLKALSRHEFEELGGGHALDQLQRPLSNIVPEIQHPIHHEQLMTVPSQDEVGLGDDTHGLEDPAQRPPSNHENPSRRIEGIRTPISDREFKQVPGNALDKLQQPLGSVVLEIQHPISRHQPTPNAVDLEHAHPLDQLRRPVTAARGSREYRRLNINKGQTYEQVADIYKLHATVTAEQDATETDASAIYRAPKKRYKDDDDEETKRGKGNGGKGKKGGKKGDNSDDDSDDEGGNSGPTPAPRTLAPAAASPRPTARTLPPVLQTDPSATLSPSRISQPTPVVAPVAPRTFSPVAPPPSPAPADASASTPEPTSADGDIGDTSRLWPYPCLEVEKKDCGRDQRPV